MRGVGLCLGPAGVPLAVTGGRGGGSIRRRAGSVSLSLVGSEQEAPPLLAAFPNRQHTADLPAAWRRLQRLLRRLKVEQTCSMTERVVAKLMSLVDKLRSKSGDRVKQRFEPNEKPQTFKAEPLQAMACIGRLRQHLVACSEIASCGTP